MPPTDQPGRVGQILYLSYDGMTDPLGRSQVLPYLVGLSALEYEFTLVSFEKPGAEPADIAAVRALCDRSKIRWVPLRYHKTPPILSTLRDLFAMRRTADQLHRRIGFDLVHCRSTLPALVGMGLSRTRRVPFVFDMRGFWADERVDGGLWPQSRKLFAVIYRWFKRQEARLLHAAAHVVSLTEAGRAILLACPDRRNDDPPITVIPCCVDLAAFPPITADRRAEARTALGIGADRLVALYLGSIGTWYMLAEMLDLFVVQRRRDPDALFLIITRDEAGSIRTAAAARGLPGDALMIRAASREEVALFAAAADYGLFFIMPTFSKQASSPTKLAELMALGLPVIANRGVGDVSSIIDGAHSGALIDTFDDLAYEAALDRIETLSTSPAAIRAAAERDFSLRSGIAAYASVYAQVLAPEPSDRNRSTIRGA